MTTKRINSPPVPAKKEPVQKSPGRQLGKKPEPDSRMALLEARARQPFEGSFGDVFPEANDGDYAGACNCWGDNNPHITKKELEKKPILPGQKAPYDLGN